MVLSQTAKLFDPLGWLAPVIVRAKITMQALWLQQLQWDDKLSTSDAQAWRRLQSELPLLNRVRIPRWMHLTLPATVEIHGFVDASERAYATVTYLRSVDKSGHVQISLLQAKIRVAPLR